MKILFCITAMEKGGAERVVSTITNSMIEKNEISIVCLADKEIAYKLDERIKIKTLDEKEKRVNKLTKNYKRYVSMKNYIKEYNPDIIISFLPVPSFIAILANKRKVPIIVADRNDPKEEYASKIYNMLMKLLYKKANGFVFQTKEQKEYFSEVIQKKSTIILNPVKEEFLKTTGEKEKENVIVSVARLEEQKNYEMLINAFSKVNKKHDEYKLKILGDGILREKLEQQIKSLNLEDDVLLYGICDNVKEELEKSKIFVLSSNYEGMPNALIEAMVLGMPVVSTDCPCGGPRELIQDNINGILVKVNDEKALAEKIIYLIENNEFADGLGKNAKLLGEKLNTKKIVAEWEDYIKIIYKNNNKTK